MNKRLRSALPVPVRFSYAHKKSAPKEIKNIFYRSDLKL